MSADSRRPAVGNGASRYLTAIPDPQAKLRLFCFHEGGGTVSVFARWAGAFGPAVTVIPVELPGHGSRAQEPLITDLDVLLHELNEHLGPELMAPYALYGHCLGAMLAHAFIRLRMRNNERLPECLVIGACPAPGSYFSRAKELLDLPDDELTKWLVDVGIIPPQIASSPQLRDRASAAARCDGNLIVQYHCTSDEPVSCPVHAFIGDVDTAGPFHDIAEWAMYTTAAFTVQTVPGGHLFHLQRPEALMSELTHLFDGYVRRLQDRSERRHASEAPRI
jgi:surfactin synthase thioesterase subunit